MKYIFGPVYSRRLGISLGVDLVPFKICSMECLYCEVGKTTNKTLQRGEYISINTVKKELSSFLSSCPLPDFVTFSGYGEPTLNLKIGEIVEFLKKNYPDISIALITNSSLLFREDVLDDIENIDIFLPSFDAASDKVFKQINRPVTGLSVNLIQEGLLKLKERASGKIWLETLFVKGVNYAIDEIKKIGDFVHRLSPDRWQINTVVRPPAFGCEGLSEEELKRIEEVVKFPYTDIIGRVSVVKREMDDKDIKKRILELVDRRPCPVNELETAFGISVDRVKKLIIKLIKDGDVEKVKYGNMLYYKRKREE